MTFHFITVMEFSISNQTILVTTFPAFTTKLCRTLYKTSSTELVESIIYLKHFLIPYSFIHHERLDNILLENDEDKYLYQRVSAPTRCFLTFQQAASGYTRKRKVIQSEMSVLPLGNAARLQLCNYHVKPPCALQTSSHAATIALLKRISIICRNINLFQPVNYVS